MTSFSSLRWKLAGTVFVAITPALVLTYVTGLPWTAFLVGLTALAAAWYGGERFVLRQVRVLLESARQVAAGDVRSRTGLAQEKGEMGELARAFDRMAERLESGTKEGEQAEKTLLNRSLQQTVVSALGQFALVGNDFSALLNQAVMLVAQTLEVEYCSVLELMPGGKSLLLRAGVGWKDGSVGRSTVAADPATVSGFALRAGEPVVVKHLPADRRFRASSLLMDHGVISGITVAISGNGRAFGLLEAHTTHQRQFTEDEIHFLLAVATLLALAVEHDRTAAQLLQAQKMESVGQLAAGIAHDFNNMLTVIQGHSGLLLVNPNLPNQMRGPTQAIYYASERAASLTRQLLMFSRKNVMQSTLLDLREVVATMGKMLQRLLGETIALEFAPPAELPLVQADRGMVEQVIMNLAVNARDASPKGGRLTVSLNPVEVNEAYVQNHAEARAGSFVCLRVSDTGTGMDPATLARIFEPFFTTKEVGKGTGLGLATVYGIVKQHGGWIEVASEVGKGTTFNVLFPASSKRAPAKPSETAPLGPVPGGKETILIVEDEPVLREMAQTILQQSGYRVLQAASGVEALRVWESHQSTVDLLLTDVVMPDGLSGVDVARKLHAAKPALKIIFVSGYSMETMDAGFLRQGEVAFLEKPYTHVTLTKAVRNCLDNRTMAQRS